MLSRLRLRRSFVARRRISAEALERVCRAAQASRELNPNDRVLLDLAHMGATLDPADVARLMTNPLAASYAPQTMRELAGGASRDPWWQAPPRNYDYGA
jgi:hypothetical protein